MKFSATASFHMLFVFEFFGFPGAAPTFFYAVLRFSVRRSTQQFMAKRACVWPKRINVYMYIYIYI